MTFLSKLSDIVYKACAAFLAFIMALLLVISFIGIITRFIFNYPLSWTYEFTIMCFSWVIFLGVSQAFDTQDHMGLTFVTNALKGNVKKGWFIAINIICLAFMVICFIQGCRVTRSTWFQSYNTIPFRRGMFYLALPVASVCSVVHIIDNTLKLIFGKKKEGDAK